MIVQQRHDVSLLAQRIIYCQQECWKIARSLKSVFIRMRKSITADALTHMASIGRWCILIEGSPRMIEMTSHHSKLNQWRPNHHRHRQRQRRRRLHFCLHKQWNPLTETPKLPPPEKIDPLNFGSGKKRFLYRCVIIFLGRIQHHLLMSKHF